MRWGVLICIFLCFISFSVGYFFGGINWSWMDSGHTSQVAFWSMIGGWLSGVATFFAVIISLWMAYQSSQSYAEKILITPLMGENVFEIGNPVLAKVDVKNLRPVTTPLLKLLIQIDGATADLAPTRIRGMQLPYTFQQLGEQWTFETNLISSIGWTSVFEMLSQQGELKFKRCYFIVETAMKQHRVKIPKEMITKLSELEGKLRAFKQANPK